VTVIKQDDGNDTSYDYTNEPLYTDEQFDKLFANEEFQRLHKAVEDILLSDEMHSARIPSKALLEKLRGALNARDTKAKEILSASDEPHDENLVGNTTRGAKPGEPAPDSDNFTNDIARTLASRRW
jgi:hypothetical protein